MSVGNVMLLLIALVGGALYAGLETGVVSLNRLRLHHLVRRKVRGAATLQRFVDQPDDLLGTTLVGTNVSHVIVSVTSASLAMAWLGEVGSWVAVVVTTLVVLVFSEYLPKAWFRSYPSHRTLPFASLLLWSFRLFYPLSRGVTMVTRWVLPAADSGSGLAAGFVTREELEFMAQEGGAAGTLSPHEQQMMRGVFALTRTAVGAMMVPRSRMATLDAEMAVEEALVVAREKGFSRFPVWDREGKRFIGIVHVLDLLSLKRSPQARVKDYVRPPQLVFARETADRLLPRMRFSRRPMALVTNGRSEVIGLITIEDLLRQIVTQI